MKRFFSILLAVCLILTGTMTAGAEELAQNGTTPDKLARGGKVACDGQTVYFACGESVYTTPLSGGGAQKMFGPDTLGISSWDFSKNSYLGPSFLNVWQGKLYFYYEDEVSYGPRSGVYYYDPATGGGGQLAKGTVTYLSVDNGIITYALWNDYLQDVFYQVNVDGSGNHATGAVVGKPVSGEMSAGGWSFFVADGWIYYQQLADWTVFASDLTSNRLYRMRLDGTQNMQVNDGYVDDIAKNFSVYQGRLYFSQGDVYTHDVNGILTDESNYQAAFCTSLADGSDKREINMGEGYIGPDGKRWGRGKENFTIWDGTLYEPYDIPSEKGEVGVRANLLDGSGARTVFETNRTQMVGIKGVYPVPGWLFLDVLISDPWSSGTAGTAGASYSYGIYRISPEGGQPEQIAAYNIPSHTWQ